MIPNVKLWQNKEWGEIYLYTAQALTGHGKFAEYLHRIGKIESPRCWYCDQIDTARQSIPFLCAGNGLNFEK